MPHNIHNKAPFNKEMLQYVASSVFVVLLFLLIGYLTFIEVPSGNKDVIITILGVILGGAASALPRVFGDSADSDTENLKSRILKLEKANELLLTRNEVLKNELDKITEMLITRHVLSNNGDPYPDSFELNSRKDSIDD